MLQLAGIDHVALAVRDVQRTAQWYIDVLGFEHRLQGMWDGVPVFIGKGTTALALFQASEPQSCPAADRIASVCCISLSARVALSSSPLSAS